jgi:hypothetical protein
MGQRTGKIQIAIQTTPIMPIHPLMQKRRYQSLRRLFRGRVVTSLWVLRTYRLPEPAAVVQAK